MKMFLAFLLGAIPTCGMAQKLIPPVEIKDIQLVEPKISHELPFILTSIKAIDTAINQEADTNSKHLRGSSSSPQFIVDGYEYFGLRMPSLNEPGNIERMEIRKDGEYKERGAIFIYTKNRKKPENAVLLSKYLKDQFKGYKHTTESRYMINGVAVKNVQQVLLSKTDVISVSKIMDRSQGFHTSVTYEIVVQLQNTKKDLPEAKRPATKDRQIFIRGMVLNRTPPKKGL